jgi:hypothetical protein
MRLSRFCGVLAGAAVLAVLAGGFGTAEAETTGKDPSFLPALSGAAEFRDSTFGLGITECPQAGIKPEVHPQPLDKRQKDAVEKVSNTGDDQRMNFEFFCFPQDETDIDVNPTNQRNAVGGANDYRMGWGTSGFYATTDNGNSWYGGVLPFPSVPGDDHVDGGGDPVIAYDRAGLVYYSHLQFERETDRNGLFVNRSTNGGFTWSRPCAPIGGTPGSPPPSEGAVCGGPGDPRQVGDGTVTFHPDPDQRLNGSEPFDDKEWMGTGPRPAGVEPTCFTAVTRTPTACPPGTVGVDRIYVTWTRFEFGVGLFGVTANIYISYSDDQARSWSPARVISGSAPFCGFSVPVGSCDLNQFSVPVVSPDTGVLYVAFENFNTPAENQILIVRSRDGGNTFEGPFFVTPVFDVTLPRSGIERPDCGARGQQFGRGVLTNSCFRAPATFGLTVDKRSGAFADDLYIAMWDNRNGTVADTNGDIFFFKSNDGGTSWIGPTRVNNDASRNDNWWPWVEIGDRGDLVVPFYDRRLDRDSVEHEWPSSRQEPGNYLVWRFGGVCSVTRADSRECLAPTAGVIEPPTEPTDFPPFVETQTVFPFKNFAISDVPNNFDYCFRAGIFCGDYDTVAIGPDNQAWATWTDARNGRSSRNQPGRNPACEQSDAFVDLFSAQSGGSIGQAGSQHNELFLVTPCPTDIRDGGGG